MKYFLFILLAFSCLTSFPRKLRVNTNNSVSNTPRDSLIFDASKIYLSCKIDSIIVFRDKIDGQYHTFSDCPCIDDAISSYFLCDINPYAVKKNICPLCFAKTKYIKVACDSVVHRKSKA